jgi:hypothetical protein
MALGRHLATERLSFLLADHLASTVEVLNAAGGTVSE